MVNTTNPLAAIGKLAQEFCGRTLPLRVLRSQRGFYIGTFDDEFGPCSRESQEYFRTQALAEAALANGSWTQKMEP